MLEKFTFSSLPSFLPKDGTIPSQRVHLQFARRKNRKKEQKNKTRKTSNPRTFVEFPAISILFYHVALAELLLNVNTFVLEKCQLKGNFPYPAFRNRHFKGRFFWVFLYFIRGSFAVNA